MGVRSFIAGSALVQAFTAPVSLPKTDELFEGVEKPTTTLARMFVAEMLQNIDVRATKYYERSASHYEEYWQYKFPLFELVTRTYDSRTTVWRVCSKTGERIEFDERERSIIVSGHAAYKRLANAQIANKKEADRQQAAVDTIERLFKREKPDVSQQVHDEQVVGAQSERPAFGLGL